MAANAVQIADHEQSIQILKHQNTKLCEQLSSKKEQIQALEANVQKYEEEKKKFADTLLCVNRIWQQFNSDVQTLCVRNKGGAPDSEDSADAPAAAAEAESEDEPLVWDTFDPFLARLLQGDAASSSRELKKHTQTYVNELSDVERALHARAAAGLEALGKLLDAMQVGGKLSGSCWLTC
jgi:E3 ubiquitin-protein ligase BRE1